MAETGSFKSYERGNRYQTTQAMFTAGMYYSDTPIPEGAAKVLVNCDVGIDGASIKPRKGLSAVYYTYANNEAYYEDTKLVMLDSKICHESNGFSYLQVVYGKEITTGYEIQIWTYKYSSNGNYPLQRRDVTTSDNIKPVVKKDLMKPGCFVGNQYFFFDINTNCLFYTSFSTANEAYALYKLNAQETTLAQTQQMGFNMLLENPYDYTDTLVDGASTMSFLSINAFDDNECSKPSQQELILNQLYYYRVSYVGGGTVRIVFDWTATDTMEWQTLSEIEVSYNPETPNPKLVIPFRSSVPKAILRCTAYALTTDSETTGTPLDVMWFAFDYQDKYTKPMNDLTSSYTLATATSMVYWQNRLVVAGVKEDPSYLFMSAPELFEYFPFPHNADYLDEPIIFLQPLLDNLLVFTKSKLYLYTLDPVSGLVRKCIQTNLNITNTTYIKPVKNMVFFKSGLYFYMVVPKLNSTTGELTIAPVYRNIKSFLDDIDTNRRAIIKEVYPDIQLQDSTLQSYYTYLDYETIHTVYMYNIEENLYINFDLMYNTVKRFWSVRTYVSPAALHVCKSDVTQPGDLFCITYISRVLTTTTGVPYTAYTPVLQLIKEQDNEDRLYPYMFEYNVVSSNKVTTITPKYNNVQYIDTGYMDINSNYKKRFREIQFRVLNDSKESLDFGTEFFIDGTTTTPKYDYVPIVDESTGTLTLTKMATSAVIGNTHIQGSTRLGSWSLSKDAFPGADVIKIRIPVSGKGYNSQIKIRCDSQQDYTLLDITSVYRPLYSR